MLNPHNILFIQADQLAAAYLSAYGNQIVDAPNLERLALNSTIFDSAYCNFPLCAPSRFSMMSGRLASTINAYDNGAEFSSAVPTFAHYLRHLGYQTCLVGKMHFVGADQLHGFEERLTTDIYPSDFGWTGDWTQLSQAHSNNDETFTRAGVCLRNSQIEYDEEVCHRAVRKIYDLARGNDSRPFMLTVSMTHPHDPYQCTQEYWDRYDNDAIDMPRVESIDAASQDPYSKRLLIQYGLDRISLSDAQIRTARHAYYGAISYLDDQIGKILDTLTETGLDKNTAIIFTSDHGDLLGERGLWYKKSFFEDSVRVPLLISIPGADPKRITENVSLVDLLPTMVDIATEGKSDDIYAGELDGASLYSMICGVASNWHNTVFSENLAEGAGAALVMVKQNQYKYIASGIDPEQLFNLEFDPAELSNLSNRSEYADIKQSLSAVVKSRWDIEELSNKVVKSQEQRMFIWQSLKQGKMTSWDYCTLDHLEQHCLRGGQLYNDWAYKNPLGPKK